MIKNYRKEQLKLRLSLGNAWESDGYVFIQWNGKQILPDIPLHGLRHTSATLLISQNIDVRTVSGRLGHAQTSTTTDIYSHFLKRADEVAADTLDNLFHATKQER